MELSPRARWRRAFPRAVVTVFCAGVAMVARGEEVRVAFNEVNFGTGVTHVDPLPSTAFAAFGLKLQEFYWGQDMRDPFGDGQKTIAGQFGKIPTVQFALPVSSVAFDYWTVDATWEIFVQAYNAASKIEQRLTA